MCQVIIDAEFLLSVNIEILSQMFELSAVLSDFVIYNAAFCCTLFYRERQTFPVMIDSKYCA